MEKIISYLLQVHCGKKQGRGTYSRLKPRAWESWTLKVCERTWQLLSSPNTMGPSRPGHTSQFRLQGWVRSTRTCTVQGLNTIQHTPKKGVCKKYYVWCLISVPFENFNSFTKRFSSSERFTQSVSMGPKHHCTPGRTISVKLHVEETAAANPAHCIHRIRNTGSSGTELKSAMI